MGQSNIGMGASQTKYCTVPWWRAPHGRWPCRDRGSSPCTAGQWQRGSPGCPHGRMTPGERVRGEEGGLICVNIALKIMHREDGLTGWVRGWVERIY